MDAVGLNFFESSVRYVDPHHPETLALAATARKMGLKVVGLFVNAGVATTVEHQRRLGLDLIQWHGDETLDELANLNGQIRVPFIRAIKLPTGRLSTDRIDESVLPWSDAGAIVLLDVDGGRQHGGTGKRLDWPAIDRWRRGFDRPWILAGGLRPENIREAIRATGAARVDVASGVECPRGVKHAARVRAFATGCRESFDRSGILTRDR